MQELVLKIESKILSSNIDSFAESVKAEIAKINTELKTDDDFAAAEAQVKELKKAEDALKAAKDEALAEAQDVRKLLEQTEEIAALLAKTRLNLDKQIKAEKERRKAEITDACRNTLGANDNSPIISTKSKHKPTKRYFHNCVLIYHIALQLHESALNVQRHFLPNA